MTGMLLPVRRHIHAASVVVAVAALAAFAYDTALPCYPQAAFAQNNGYSNSPFEREFGDVKFLDAYFGTLDEKIEVEAGDSNVPFTVIFANVGTQDITGITGQLSLPFGFIPPTGPGTVIYADSDTNSLAGDTFTLTFYVNIDQGTPIGLYPAAAKVDYSRLRESGVRTEFVSFDFKVTGDTVVNVKAVEPFLTSLRINDVVIEIANDGTAPLAGVEVIAANTQTERASTTASTTNVENIVLSESSWDLGQIKSDSIKTITTTVYVPETLSGETMRIPLDISYYNAHGDKIVISKIVDFFVKGLIDIAVFNVDVINISGSPMIVGEIINEGNEDGLFGFVHVTPLASSNLRPASQFLDEIEVDAPVPFNIPVEFDGPPRYGSHDIQIEVRYKDSIRDEHIIMHDAQVVVQEPPPPERSPFDFSGYGSGVDGASEANGNGAANGGVDGDPDGALDSLFALLTMPVVTVVGGGIDVPVVAILIVVIVVIAWRLAVRRRRRRSEGIDDDDDDDNGEFANYLSGDEKTPQS